MPAYYFDPSAVVKWYVVEDGTETVDAILTPDAGHAIHIASVGGVEVITAPARRGRVGADIRDDILTAIQEFQEDFGRRWRVTPFTPDVRAEAISLGMRHFLRGYDAVHLASATLVARRREEVGLTPLTLVSADAQLNAAAEAEGLAVLSPVA